MSEKKCDRCRTNPVLLQVNKLSLCKECYDTWLKDVGEMLRKFTKRRTRT